LYRLRKSDLKSPAKFKEILSEYIEILRSYINDKFKIDFDTDTLSELLLSACRVNEFSIVEVKGRSKFLNKDKVQEWVDKKLIPNTVTAKLDDEDVIRLLIFCIEFAYQMFAGGTRATVTQKGFRQRRRTFESILVDLFVGRLGEVMFKKFIEKKFPLAKIELDWEISREIEKYKNDVINAKKRVSIKTSPSLAGVWAEADIGYDYGVMVKCSVPQPTILQFFIEICSFSRLLDFAEERIPVSDTRFKGYLGEIRKRIINYRCGEIQTELKGFICGYFKTSEYKPRKLGEKLSYLGDVREERYIIKINELKYTKNDWSNFLREIGILP